MPNPSVVTALARSFLAGEHSVDQIVARAAHTLGRDWRWLRAAAQRYVSATPQGTRPRLRDVVEFLRSDRALRRAGRGLQIAHWIAGPQLMQPAPVAADWPIPPIESAGDLAMWLQLTTSDLDWFADLRALGYKQTEPKLRHYHYRVLYKRSGAIRLIEAPKPRLKEMQRRILSQILEKIPAHPAVHGFLKNRSIRTFAAPHTGRPVVLRMDLRDFFPSFTGARIQTFFRMAGYPESVADLLGGICTNCAPRDAWAAAAHEVDRRELHDARLLYGRPHLPQGAPTSPALANLCFYRIDCRLAGLAKAAGAEYTRYADDLAFSGGDDFARRVERFSVHAAALLLEEGFDVHHRKTRVMRQGVRQHLAGLVTNTRLNIRRDDFDRLKAILTNCVRHGPASQNRDGHLDFRAHLQGRIAFVESVNASRAARLRGVFERIAW